MRIDNIYDCLKREAGSKGMTASQIAGQLCLSRANVSHDLNRLVAAGKAGKSRGKPIFYYPLAFCTPEESRADRFNRFVADNPCLYSVIEQGKAAVLYPPDGINMLILGETGVGKSTFAELMYDYGRIIKRISPDAPFIIFNCADYANNAQLLLGQLFGSKKGAYTGSGEDRVGLLEKADGGVLFLDEVHRLPPEGQEMFFTFLDKGFFRRLGETEAERRVRVRIFASTTEEPEASLLRTFTRRFPTVIRLPPLQERSWRERFALIQGLFNHEAAHLQQNIVVSVNALRALLSYDCPDNIGQLKADIHFACAAAYAEFFSGKSEQLFLRSRMLPPHISAALFSKVGHRQLWSEVPGVYKRKMIFTGQDRPVGYEDNQRSTIYELLSLRISELKSKGTDCDVLDDEIEKTIADYFQTRIADAALRFDKRKLLNFVSAKVLRLTEEIIRYAEEKLQAAFSNKIYYGLATHIEQAVQRLRRNEHIVHPHLNRIRAAHGEIFSVALDCLRLIESVMEINLPLDEAGFLAMFFVYSISRSEPGNSGGVRVLVVAHGNRTASEMAETANALLGVNYAVAFNVPLEEKVQHVVEHILSYLNARGDKNDILLLVDMGALAALGATIARHCQINVRTLQLTSTLHVIEAVQRAMNGERLDEVCQAVLHVNQLLPQEKESGGLSPVTRFQADSASRLVIVTLCTTGDGTARVIKKLLAAALAQRKNRVDIISMSLADEKAACRQLETLQKSRTVVAVISPFRLKTAIPQIDLTEVLHQQGLDRLHNMVDTEAAWMMLEASLKQILNHIQPMNFLAGMKVFHREISRAFNIDLSANRLIGLAMHMACLFERCREAAADAIISGKEEQTEPCRPPRAINGEKYPGTSRPALAPAREEPVRRPALAPDREEPVRRPALAPDREESVRRPALAPAREESVSTSRPALAVGQKLPVKTGEPDLALLRQHIEQLERRCAVTVPDAELRSVRAFFSPLK